MSISHTPHHFRRQLLALAASLISIVCASQSEAGVTIMVDTLDQGVTNGKCSLQEAIYASEFKSNKAIQSTSPDLTYMTGCTAGDGDGDIIVLPANSTFYFDHFWNGDGHNPYGPTATPIIFSKIIIQGNGATLRWINTFRPGNSHLFTVGEVDDPTLGKGTGDLTLKNVYIKDFNVKGGDGASGGGGGLGAGGAIYNDGTLTIENSTFEHNGAVGGTGSGGASGGGGGLSGSGGRGCAPWGAGGGGGSGGNGGNGNLIACGPDNVGVVGGGGGGGGTVFPGGDGSIIGGQGGFSCGGGGGKVDGDGDNAPCEGGGGGGGAGGGGQFCWLHAACAPDGGDADFGGGGGGGVGDGGNGGFGGGGGAAFDAYFKVSGGNGGFGAGGGAAPNGIFHSPGKGGHYGGHADNNNGGGGGALGGAIFNTGILQVRNSTFFNNYVTRGESGGGSSAKGADAGGAIFSKGILLDVNDSTFSGNQATGSGGAIVVFAENGVSVLRLHNTIIANNGANECFGTTGAGFSLVDGKGAGNLIMQNGSGGQFIACPGGVTTSDPQLQPLQLVSPSNTPTMAIPANSPAIDQADASTSLSTDQRGVPRPQGAGFDIGAFEVSSGRCAEASAFLARANAVATIDPAHTAAYSDLICGLVEDRTYSRLDALYVLATQSDGGSPGDGIAKLNLIKDSFNLVGHGTYAFGADKGAACDGSSGYYDTQFNLSSSGIAFSRDSASLGLYDRSTTTTNGTAFGADQDTTFTELNLNFLGGLYFRINSIDDGPIAPNSNAQGFWIGTRTGASSVSVYRNGSPIGTTTTPSDGVPALSPYLCASNSNGAAGYFVGDEIAAFFIGGALDPSQASKLSSRINAFMTALGANVY
jgi:hypothetical protein